MSHLICQFNLNHPETSRRIGEFLRNAGYAEENLLKRLRLDALQPHRERMLKLPLLLQRTAANKTLDQLIRLFFLRQAIPIAVDSADLHDWQEVGIIDIADDKVTANVELYPFEDLILATDWPTPPGKNPDEVMCISPASQLVAQLTIRRHSSHTLDWGAGGGIQALLASAHSDKVTAVDCNPRAAMFAEFNAELNGCMKINYLIGDMFEPVAGQTFDLIVSCPPFVISPDVQLVHSHNALPADELCRSIVQTAPAYLNEGGYCQVPGNWAQFAGQDWRDRLAELCKSTRCDAILTYSHTEDVATYAWDRIKTIEHDSFRAEKQFKKWLTYFENQQIEAVGFGLVTLRRAKRATNWFHAEQIRPKHCGEMIERRFAALDCLEKYREDRALLDARLRRSARLRSHQSSDCSNRDWSVIDSQLCDVDDPSATTKVGPEVLAFLKQCDGSRSVEKCFRNVAKGKAHSPPAGFLKVVRRLIELGFLGEAKN